VVSNETGLIKIDASFDDYPLHLKFVRHQGSKIAVR
jgi:hypothetical protein